MLSTEAIRGNLTASIEENISDDSVLALLSESRVVYGTVTGGDRDVLSRRPATQVASTVYDGVACMEPTPTFRMNVPILIGRHNFTFT